MYGSYHHVKKGIELGGIPPDELVISSKSTAAGYEQMEQAIEEALSEMNLKSMAEEALVWVRDHPLVDAVALGMMSTQEVDMNWDVFTGKAVSAQVQSRLSEVEKNCSSLINSAAIVFLNVLSLPYG